MTTRRDILKTGASALALTSINHGAFGLAAAAGQIRLPFDTFIMDDRLAGSEGLSRVAAASGMQCVWIRGDLTGVWFDTLRGACLEGSTVIAGLTSDLDSEVMRAFARDVGYRQELRVEITVGGQTGTHALRRSRNSAPPSESSMASGLDELIDHYMNAPMPGPEQHSPTQLAAWVIAPIRG